MTHRTTITLDNEAYRFLMSAAKENRSGFINELLKKEKDRALSKALIAANKEEANDVEYQNELAVWDETMGDGI